MWCGIKSAEIDKFVLQGGENLSEYRYFCKPCGTHVYIKYDMEEGTPWSNEIHVPAAILSEDSVHVVERTMEALEKPRYLHVFTSDISACKGDFHKWADAPKYGGNTGLVPLRESSEMVCMKW